MNSLICFPVSCSYDVGQVSSVWVMAVWSILLSFSGCVHLKMMWSIVCSSCSLQGQVEFGIILNLCRYDLVKPWPVTIAVNSSDIGSMVGVCVCGCVRVCARVRACVCVCVGGKNLIIVSMCAVSPMVHTSNISSCQKKTFPVFLWLWTIPLR